MNLTERPLPPNQLSTALNPFSTHSNPSHRQLRQFGLLCVVLFPLVSWWWEFGSVCTLTLFLVGASIAIASIVWPTVVKWIFLTVTTLTIPVGIAMSELAVFLIFVLVFLPIGLLFRLRGRDALQLKENSKRETYWQKKRETKKMADYFRMH